MKSAHCFQNLSPCLTQAMEAAVASSPAAMALVDGEFRIHVASPSLGNLVGSSWEELLGRPYLDLFTEDQQLPMAERLRLPPDPQFFFPTRLLHRDGSTREVDGRCYRLDIPDEDWVVVILLDVTSERRLLRKLGGISLVASSLTYAGGLRATLDSVSQRVVETTDALAAAVMICDDLPEGDFRFRLGGTYGLPSEGLACIESALSNWKELDQLGIELPPVKARRTRQLEVFDNLSQRLQEAEMGQLPDCVQKLFCVARSQVWNCLAAVPILLAGRFLGTLNCYYSSASAPEAAELNYLQTLADLAGVALENARLLEECEKQAILQERRRLARELHDSVSQALYGIALGAKTVKARWSSHPEKAQQSLDYVIELAEGAGKEMRALLYSLRPESLQEEGLVQALQRQAEALKARYGIEVHCQISAEPDLEAGARLALFRVASESLHNVVKHSEARNVQLNLGSQGKYCVLEVEDDGVGFEAATPGPNQYGLANMRERVEGLGGIWSIESAPSQGTRIAARLPLRVPQL